MVPTEELEVLELGFSTLLPRDDVINVAPLGGPQASRMLTMSIAGDHGSAKTGRDNPGLAAHVQDFGVRTHDDPCDRGIASEPFAVGGDEHGPFNCLADSAAIDQHKKMGLFAALFRESS